MLIITGNAGKINLASTVNSHRIIFHGSELNIVNTEWEIE
jgi:hypothetical protein